ncbi:hypothetical protein BS17DRAFT_698783 [Gyrodon lividus]|nr:hypothetical protein BS17DRAFT_698783 [Gyrodon lividus]
MSNSHGLTIPDYTAIEYTEAHAMFTADGRSDAGAALILVNIWCFNNTLTCQLWDRQQEALEEARQAELTRTAKLQEQERIIREEEEELARWEECKKYKNKYAPIQNTPLSDSQILTLCCYVDAKSCLGEYCPLFYYTNKGHRNNLY